MRVNEGFRSFQVQEEKAEEEEEKEEGMLAINVARKEKAS